MSMHLRNSRDMMPIGNEIWWNSRTPLEQKLIILCGVLFVLSFCLIISLIVINNRKHGGGGGGGDVTNTPTVTISSTEPTKSTEAPTGETTVTETVPPTTVSEKTKSTTETTNPTTISPTTSSTKPSPNDNKDGGDSGKE